MTIKATDANIGYAIEFNGGACFNTIDSNKIEASLFATTDSSAAIYSGESNNDNNNSNNISNNEISGGYYGIYFDGSTNYESKNVFDANKINNFYKYGAYFSHQDYLQFNNNNIETRNDLVQITGAYLEYCYLIKIIGNKIKMQGNVSQRGLVVWRLNVNRSNTSLIANNFISLTGSTTSFLYGLQLTVSSYVNIYYNSINIVSSSIYYGRAVYQQAGSNLNFKNNIFTYIGSGYAFRTASPSAIISSDYNNYYSTGVNLAYWGANVTNLAALQAANSMDANSSSINPTFFSNSDLHLNFPSINGTATPIAGITKDIDGDIRDTIAPDMGADEFSIISHDLRITELITPNHGFCRNITDSIRVILKNFGNNSETNVPVHATIHTPSGTVSANTTISNIPPYFNDTIVLGALNTTTQGNYTYTVYPTLMSDINHSNDTLFVTENSYTNVNFGSDVFVCGSASKTLDAGIGTTYLWSDNRTNQILNIDSSGYGFGTEEFWVIVTDENGCFSTDTIELTFVPGYTVDLGPDDKMCSDDSKILDAGMGIGYTYLWSNNSTTQTITVDTTGYGLGTHILWVKVSNSNCSITDTIELTFTPNPIVNLGADTTIKLSNGALILNAGAGFASYLWDNMSLIATRQIFASVVGLGIHTYYVTVTDSNSCMASDTIVIEVIDDTGIEGKFKKEFIFLFPNPTKGIFNIATTGITGNLEINIIDISGRILRSEKLIGVKDGYVKEIDISMLAKGVYYIRLKNNDIIILRKLVIQ